MFVGWVLIKRLLCFLLLQGLGYNTAGLIVGLLLALLIIFLLILIIICYFYCRYKKSKRYANL